MLKTVGIEGEEHREVGVIITMTAANGPVFTI